MLLVDMIMILSVTFALLFLVIIGILVQKYLRRSKHGGSAWRSRERRPNEIVTPIVMKTFDGDNRLLYGGREHIL